MCNYKIIVSCFLVGVLFSCAKHDPLLDLEPRSIPPPPPTVYSYGGNVMVQLDSFTIKPWGTTSSFVLANYVSVKDNILALYATKYSKINVYDGNTTYGNLPYPTKTFSKIVTSGQVFKYSFVLVDTANVPSVSSLQYTVTIP